MIFPEQENKTIEIFHCPLCKKNYVRGFSDMSCCVQHGPGSCCHFTDKFISDEKIVQILKLTKEKE